MPTPELWRCLSKHFDRSRRIPAGRTRIPGTGVGTASWRTETGSATVTALATIGAMLVVLSGLLLVAGVAAARGEAQSAADLGALAAASASLQGEAGCRVAAEVIAANDATMGHCRAEAGGAVVTATVPVTWAGRPTEFTAEAAARAGPAW